MATQSQQRIDETLAAMTPRQPHVRWAILEHFILNPTSVEEVSRELSLGFHWNHSRAEEARRHALRGV